MYTMCMHYVTTLFTLVYTFYEHKPECKEIKETEHWGQWTIIDEN